MTTTPKLRVRVPARVPRVSLGAMRPDTSLTNADGEVGREEVQGQVVEAPSFDLSYIDDYLEKLKIPRIHRPLDEEGGELAPVLPASLQQLEDEQLTQLYTSFCAMTQWMGVIAARVSAHRAKLEMDLKRLRSRIFISSGGNRELKAAAVDVHPDVVALEEQFLIAQAMEGTVQATFSAYITGKEATSRDFTRRQGTEWGRGGMEGGFRSPRRG